MLNGGKVGFADSDLIRVFDAFRIISPTYLLMLPAVGQALRSEFQACYDREMANPPLGVIRNSAGHRASSKAKAITYMISCLGPRCRAATIGGAKVSPALLQLM